MANETEYINLRKTLDSFRAVVLADYDLFRTSEEKTKFSDLVTEKIKTFLMDNSVDNQEMWVKAADRRALEHSDHAEALLAKDFALCPPGFKEVDGICVPI